MNFFLDKENSINAGMLASIIRGEVQKDSLTSKTDLILIEEMLSTLYTKKEFLLELKEEARLDSENSAKRRVRMLFYLVSAQILFSQYGTYVKYSWDILEPITCLFGIFDMIVGYSYWMMNDKNFSYENFEKGYLDQRVEKDLGKQIGFEEEMEDITSMIEHMEVYKYLQSDDLPDILEALDDKFDLVKEE